MSCQNPTKCNRDRRNNVWVEGNVDDETGLGGICMLDTLTTDQVAGVLQHNETARGDLVRVTDDPELLYLAANVPRLPTAEPADEEMKHFKPPVPPYYALYKGRF